MLSPSVLGSSVPAPTVFDRCFAALMVNEVGSDPLDPHCWSSGSLGVGIFVAPRDGLDMSVQDGGNWTGGAMGLGVLGGTRWGIDSASYPDGLTHLPAELRATYPALVRDLTIDEARELTRYGYWQRVHGDDLPGRLALLVLDAAFNNGVGTAARWLQGVVGTGVDGVIGMKTVAAVQAAVAARGLDEIAVEFHAERVSYMTRLPSWALNGLGWSRRLTRLPFQAAALAA
jgi:hypothetical protein